MTTTVPKLNLAETLLTKDGSDLDDSSSLNNNVSHSSKTENLDWTHLGACFKSDRSRVSKDGIQGVYHQLYDLKTLFIVIERPIGPSSLRENPAETSSNGLQHSATSECQQGQSKYTHFMHNQVCAPGSTGIFHILHHLSVTHMEHLRSHRHLCWRQTSRVCSFAACPDIFSKIHR